DFAAGKSDAVNGVTGTIIDDNRVDAGLDRFNVGLMIDTEVGSPIGMFRIGGTERIDPSDAETIEDIAGSAVIKARVDFDNRLFLYFEVIGLGVRRDKAMAIAGFVADIHNIQTGV